MDPAILLCSSTANIPNKKYGSIFSTDVNDSEFHSLSLGVEIVLCVWGLLLSCWFLPLSMEQIFGGKVLDAQ